MKKSKQIGKIEGKEEVATDMLLDGMAVDKVAKLTKLSIEKKIRNLIFSYNDKGAKHMLPAYKVLADSSINSLNITTAYDQPRVDNRQLSEEKNIEFGSKIAELQELQTLLSIEVEILDLQISYLDKCRTAKLLAEDCSELQKVYNLEFKEKLELFVDDYKNLVAGRDGTYRNNQLVMFRSKAEKSQEIARYRDSLMQHPQILQHQTWLLQHTPAALEQQLRQIKENRVAKKTECEAIFNKRQQFTTKMAYFYEDLQMHRKQVQNLIEQQREELLSTISKTEQHPIYKACANGNIAGLKAQLPNRDQCLEYISQHAPRALHLACEANQLQLVRFLLEEIGLRQIKDINGYFPIHYAAKYQARDTSALLGYLLTKGALVDSLGVYGRSPLHTACLYGNLSAVKFLLRYGANINRQETGRFQSNTPLHNAAFAGYTTIVRTLLKSGANPRIFNKIGNKSALLEAIEQGHISVSTTFLEFGIWLSASEYTKLPSPLTIEQKQCLTQPLAALQQFNDSLQLEDASIKQQNTARNCI